jgi:hypothetical protein
VPAWAKVRFSVENIPQRNLTMDALYLRQILPVGPVTSARNELSAICS